MKTNGAVHTPVTAAACVLASSASPLARDADSVQEILLLIAALGTLLWLVGLCGRALD